MASFHRYVSFSALKAAICFVFIGFAEMGQAQILGGPPRIAVQPLGLAVQNGGTALITSTAISATPMKLYWYFNGQPVPTNNTTTLNVSIPLLGTVSTLTIKNLSPANEGAYSLRVTNTANLSAVSSNATLIVLANVLNVVNFIASETGMTTNGFKIKLSGPIGSNYVIQASSDLKSWVSLSTNAAPEGSVTYTDTTAVAISSRFYRAAIK